MVTKVSGKVAGQIDYVRKDEAVEVHKDPKAKGKSEYIGKNKKGKVPKAGTNVSPLVKIPPYLGDGESVILHGDYDNVNISLSPTYEFPASSESSVPPPELMELAKNTYGVVIRIRNKPKFYVVTNAEAKKLREGIKRVNNRGTQPAEFYTGIEEKNIELAQSLAGSLGEQYKIKNFDKEFLDRAEGERRVIIQINGDPNNLYYSVTKKEAERLQAENGKTRKGNEPVIFYDNIGGLRKILEMTKPKEG